MTINPTNLSFQPAADQPGAQINREKEMPVQGDQVTLGSSSAKSFMNAASIPTIPSIHMITPVQAIQPVQAVQPVQAIPTIPGISGSLSSTVAKGNVVSTATASHAASAGPGAPAVYKALEDQIKMMEDMKYIMDKVGNKAKAQELGAKIAEKKKDLAALKASPPPVFSQSDREDISAYIEGKGPMPSKLSPDQQKALDRMASLARNGMHFTNGIMEELPAGEAFARIMENPQAGFGDQVSYKTYSNGNIVMATMRPPYLAPLDVFITGTRKGYVFYDNSSGKPEPVLDAGDFIKKFKDRLDEALVWAVDGSYVSPEKADEIKARFETEELASGLDTPGDRPSIEESENEVIIGGIVLEKKR